VIQVTISNLWLENNKGVFSVYLDLLLKVLDVVHGQIQHVGSVGLLQP
jgi:hypothetical protein